MPTFSNNWSCIIFFKDIVPVDASYEVKELYVPENKLDLAKADAETLPAIEIGKVSLSHTHAHHSHTFFICLLSLLKTGALNRKKQPCSCHRVIDYITSHLC